MTRRVVRYADMPDLPWANGGGSTRLLWSDPVGERRVSVAMLERPAPFSILPGMARLMVVLDPIMIELDVRGDRTMLRRHDHIAFGGDDPVALIALDRPGRVLNLMASADRWRPSVDRPVRDRVPVGWMPREDDVDVRSGDVVLGTSPPPHAITIDFLEVDLYCDIP